MCWCAGVCVEWQQQCVGSRNVHTHKHIYRAVSICFSVNHHQCTMNERIFAILWRLATGCYWDLLYRFVRLRCVRARESVYALNVVYLRAAFMRCCIAYSIHICIYPKIKLILIFRCKKKKNSFAVRALFVHFVASVFVFIFVFRYVCSTALCFVYALLHSAAFYVYERWNIMIHHGYEHFYYYYCYCCYYEVCLYPLDSG